ncbi:uncharacterized protein Dana_GF28050, isoform B [Drosophila ananassae]|uniref:Uncharacterized protein, isoform B n=1 Tax=Drosophila ananassae TaxID=7217 RepID=A0A0P8Y500_DROAN|nr:uncharacterized protein Dana_GF28050, isoform B [Drosophila ananassae]
MHKRIYAAAENILPGCLFNMIIKDITGINCGSAGTVNKQKCCSCKNTMCCDANEEKLMRKVMRLENDIENAKMCLKNLKSIPSKLSIQRCRLDGGDSSLISIDIDRVKHNRHFKEHFPIV